MHYSRIAPVDSGRRYLPSTAVLLVELIKFVVSLSIATFETAKANPTSSPRDLVVLLRNSIFSPDAWKLIIPAGLYTVQNFLIYVAISNLEAVTFQVTYQLKILTTVLFSVQLLGKKISSQQWLALVLLTIGVAIVQTSGPLSTALPSLEEIKSKLASLFSTSPSDSSKSSFLQGQPETARLPHNPTMSAPRGLLAVIAASLISGLTCVYFELIVKSTISSVSLWIRNVQLSFYSVFLALFIGVIYQDGSAISEHGFFAGYNSVVWLVIALQALGGLVVAVVITIADNLTKNFATCISIVVSCVASAMVFGTGFSLQVSLLYILSLPLPFSFISISNSWLLLLPGLKAGQLESHGPLFHA
jgi:UDP-galactose transporter